MRCLIAVAVSVALGFAPAAVVNLASMWRFWVVLTCMQAVFLLASLLVVRWCGYRMLGRPQSQAG